MTWPQIWRAPLEVSWSVFVFVFQLRVHTASPTYSCSYSSSTESLPLLPHRLSPLQNCLTLCPLLSCSSPIRFPRLPSFSNSQLLTCFLVCYCSSMHSFTSLPCVPFTIPLLPSNNSVQISMKHRVPKYSIYQDKHEINTRPTQTQHTGSLANLPMMLAHALQLSSVITELEWQKKNNLSLHQIHSKCFPVPNCTTLNISLLQQDYMTNSIPHTHLMLYSTKCEHYMHDHWSWIIVSLVSYWLGIRKMWKRNYWV